MTISRRIGRAVLGRTLGRTRWQWLWRALHGVSLLGLNYGRATVEDSGEQYALRYAAERAPRSRCIIDVGANSGSWTLAAQDAWPEATVHAFEPSAAMFGELSARVPGAVLVQAALGDCEGVATLYAVPGLSGLSSLHNRDLGAHGMTMSSVETVPVTTLDGYCAVNDISQVDYLKIDAEGHDLAVLRGASGLLERGAIRFVQFEFGGCNIDSRTFLRDFVRLLEPRYRIYRMLVDGLEPLRYTERDEVFVTSNFLAEHR
jgi:FkbM family methyltransferase